MNISQYIETVKQLSYASPAYRSTISINIGMTGSAIKNFGTPEQKKQWLEPLLEGKIRSCFAMTEPALLPGDSNNYLASVILDEKTASVSYTDVTTGEFAVTELPLEALRAE